MTMPDVLVELALNAGYTTAAASRTWTDVSTYVDPPLRITRGRTDQLEAVQASRLTCTLDNTDGRFTPEYTSGAYYPNIKKGRPIRVRTTSAAVIGFDSFGIADSAVGVWDGPAGPGRTATTGGTWTGQVQDWGVSSTKAYMPGTGGTVTLDVGQSDVTVECTFTTGASLSTGNGLACRYVDDNNRIRVVTDTGGGGRWVMQKIIAGATTNVASGGTAAVSTTYALKVVLAGSSVEVFVNGVSTLSGTISDAAVLTATKFGMTAVSSSTDVRWDDFTVTGVAASSRFLGYVDEWPVSWPGGSKAIAQCDVTANSRRARLGRSAAFRSIIEEEYLDDDPKLYYPLGEPEDSTTAGNIAAGRSEVLTAFQNGTGGTLAFGTSTGPGTDDLTAPTFAPVAPTAAVGNGLGLLTTLASPITTTGDHVIQMGAFFSAPAGGVALPRAIISLQDEEPILTNAPNELRLYLNNTTGQLFGTAMANGVPITAAVVNPATVVQDGLTHHAVLTATISDAGTITMSITLDGVVTTGAAGTWPFVVGGVAHFPTYKYLGVGMVKTSAGWPWEGSLSHAAVFVNPTTAVTTARLQSHYNAGANGFAGEASGARVARYARLAGIPTAEISTETGLSTSLSHRDTTGLAPVEAMDDVALTEDGVVFDGKDGTLTFHARSHRYGATSSFTLDCDAGNVEVGLLPRLDDQGLLNDVKASRPDGITARSVNQTSIDENGYYRADFELQTTSDAEVRNRADWEVNRRGTPRVSIPTVRVNLLNSGIESALLAADIGTRITLTNLPPQAPATTMDFFIEGITEDIGREEYFIEFNVSPAVLSAVWTLDSASYSQLDSTTVLAY